MKQCNNCNVEKPLEEFYNHSRAKDGKRNQCKSCMDEYTKEYNKKNRQRINEKSKLNRLKNPERYRERVQRYRDNNREKIREKNRITQRRWKKNPINRAIHNLRTRLVDCIVKGTKSSGTINLLGCEIEKFKLHLEEQFTDGMTWDNYGEWHIDHILPVSSFDMSLPDQQKKCFHYSNLQPLWAEDNFRKSNKT
jgi:hypothetical protein